MISADHYVFPDDSPPEEPDVVRTVEEENLFSVAFPHMVQLFNKELAEAKENKSKSLYCFLYLIHNVIFHLI